MRSTLHAVAASARRDVDIALVRQRAEQLFPAGPRVAAAPAGAPAGVPPAAPAGPVGAVPPVASAVTALPSGAPPGWRERCALALRERWDLDRRAVVGLLVLVLLALGYAVQHFWLARPEPVAVAAVGPEPAVSQSEAAVAPPAGRVVVDVSGRVRQPGVRELPGGARVQDALRAAGGPLPGTDLTGLNLARRVSDGEEIIVGRPAAPPGAPAAPAGPAGAAGAPGGTLSLSTATAAELDALPGIGPVLAQRIVQYRQQHGGFTSVDQLRQVSGFGERRLRDLRDRLRP
ncbi:helix-hairpin-helix domain-containing protein [Streptacidiphilus monticola]|uniref:Helix-hairpin-helix domain-containing protein n=1 Tax=Streptacidiphilus monticola TaxID=2161674 RepID=A0ABW1FZB3_9ACTN